MPRKKNARRKPSSILVIGGGVAGLTAGVELAQAGWRVTILEARERLGGRIYTIHDGGSPVELGAEFVHQGNKPLWQRIRAARLETIDVTDRNQLITRGARRRVSVWQEAGRIIQRIDPAAPDQSFADFLANQKLSPARRELAIGFVQGFDAADPARIGAHALRAVAWDPDADTGMGQFRIERGYSALVDFLSEQLRSLKVEINTGTNVVAVRWRGGRVEVRAKQNGRTKVFTADAMLVTLPLGVLKSGAVIFDPPLHEKAGAIDGLQFGNVVRLVVSFREPFWPVPGFGFAHAFEEPIPTWWSDDRGPMLVGWAGGPKADALLRLARVRLVDEALGILSRIFGVRKDSLHRRLSAVHTHNWRTDPFSRGAYSYIPVRGLELPGTLAAPVADTLFFAGEACEVESGTVHGALASGLRAAKEAAQSR